MTVRRHAVYNMLFAFGACVGDPYQLVETKCKCKNFNL